MLQFAHWVTDMSRTRVTTMRFKIGGSLLLYWVCGSCRMHSQIVYFKSSGQKPCVAFPECCYIDEFKSSCPSGKYDKTTCTSSSFRCFTKYTFSFCFLIELRNCSVRILILESRTHFVYCKLCKEKHRSTNSLSVMATLMLMLIPYCTISTEPLENASC